MGTKETFYRTAIVRREARRLPASTYNMARLLLCRSPGDAVFIPIRSMLYLAVLDAQEILFLDGAVSRRHVVLAWQHFRSGQRARLDDPVRYEVVYYQSEALGIMHRLQGEFHRALQVFQARQQRTATGHVLPWRPG